MKTLKDFENKLLHRRELQVVVEAQSNIGFANATKEIASFAKAKEDVVVINNVKSKFGRHTFLIDAFVYKNVDEKNRIEPRPRVVKKKEGQ
ncbi:MAG: hypothetical protein WCK90_02785 [archaeon]